MDDHDDSALVKKKIRELLDAESGMDRIKRMYSFNEYNDPSPEMLYIMKGAYLSAIFGGFIRACTAMSQARANFLRSNEATAFESAHLARRKLTDTMSLAGIRAMLTQGFKIGSFTAGYMLLTLSAANYNNKVTVWEHIAAGGILGSVTRFKYGPKGMLAAGLLGGTMGLFAGGVIKMSMWFSGTSVAELRYWQHEYYNQQYMMKPKKNEKQGYQNVT